MKTEIHNSEEENTFIKNFLGGTIENIEDDNIYFIKPNLSDRMFSYLPNVKNIDLPNLHGIQTHPNEVYIEQNFQLEKINMPKYMHTENISVKNCPFLTELNLMYYVYSRTAIKKLTMYGCPHLETITLMPGFTQENEIPRIDNEEGNQYSLKSAIIPWPFGYVGGGWYTKGSNNTNPTANFNLFVPENLVETYKNKLTYMSDYIYSIGSKPVTSIEIEKTEDIFSAFSDIKYISSKKVIYNNNLPCEQIGVIWTVDKPDIAEINSAGAITIKNKPANNTILTVTATSKFDKNLTDSYQIKFKDLPIPRVVNKEVYINQSRGAKKTYSINTVSDGYVVAVIQEKNGTSVEAHIDFSIEEEGWECISTDVIESETRHIYIKKINAATENLTIIQDTYSSSYQFNIILCEFSNVDSNYIFKLENTAFFDKVVGYKSMVWEGVSPSELFIIMNKNYNMTSQYGGLQDQYFVPTIPNKISTNTEMVYYFDDNALSCSLISNSSGNTYYNLNWYRFSIYPPKE